MSKEADRANLERMVREAMEKKNVAVKKGDTRMEAKCGKCGVANRVKLAPGETRATFKCKECGHQQSTL
jgi:transcription elongation factor Elf1